MACGTFIYIAWWRGGGYDRGDVDDACGGDDLGGRAGTPVDEKSEREETGVVDAGGDAAENGYAALGS